MYFLFFFLVLSLLVIIHELGHFFAARMFGIKAEEFGFGFPPRIFGIVKDGKRWKVVGSKDKTGYKNTIWSLNWFPLGGFVRIKGEQEDGVNDKDSIHQKPIWQRVIVIAAGVVMNWLLAAALFTAIFAYGTVAFLDELPAGAHVSDRFVAVTDVLPASPAAAAGLQAGDEIVAVQGVKVSSAEDARARIGSRGQAPVSITVKRDSKEIALNATPAFLADFKKVAIGVGINDVGSVSFALPQAAYYGARLTVVMSVDIVRSVGSVLGNLFVHGKVQEDLSGPVGIAVVANKIAKQGIVPFLQFAGMLSVNLAVINFLPIPALDGGRVLFLILEKIRRRPMGRHLEIGIHNVAFLILLLIIILVTAKDLTKYGGLIVGGLRNVAGI